MRYVLLLCSVLLTACASNKKEDIAVIPEIHRVTIGVETSTKQMNDALIAAAKKFVEQVPVYEAKNAHDIEGAIVALFTARGHTNLSLQPEITIANPTTPVYTTWNAHSTLSSRDTYFRVLVYPGAEALSWYKKLCTRKCIDGRLQTISSAKPTLFTVGRFVIDNQNYLAIVERAGNEKSCRYFVNSMQKASSFQMEEAKERAAVRFYEIGKELCYFHGTNKTTSPSPMPLITREKMEEDKAIVLQFLLSRPSTGISEQFFTSWYTKIVENSKKPIFHLGYVQGNPSLDSLGYDEEKRSLSLKDSEQAIYASLGNPIGCSEYDCQLFLCHLYEISVANFKYNDLKDLASAFEKGYTRSSCGEFKEATSCAGVAATLSVLAHTIQQEALMRNTSPKIANYWASLLDFYIHMLKRAMELPENTKPVRAI